jgi:hypothetical protein
MTPAAALYFFDDRPPLTVWSTTEMTEIGTFAPDEKNRVKSVTVWFDDQKVTQLIFRDAPQVHGPSSGSDEVPTGCLATAWTIERLLPEGSYRG